MYYPMPFTLSIIFLNVLLLLCIKYYNRLFKMFSQSNFYTGKTILPQKKLKTSHIHKQRLIMNR